MNEYLRWLRAAYRYYVTPGEDTGMSDYEWDQLSRKFYADKDNYPASDYPVLHHSEFTGGSLFWLKRGEYPEEVK